MTKKSTIFNKGCSMSSIIVGIDISKDKFDVCILKEKSKEIQRSFPNSSKGFQEFSKLLSSSLWLLKQQVGMERIYADFYTVGESRSLF
jgi:hypothetical protein